MLGKCKLYVLTYTLDILQHRPISFIHLLLNVYKAQTKEIRKFAAYLFGR